MNKLYIRQAIPDDLQTIFSLVKGLAEYEKRPQDMTANLEQFQSILFEQKIADCVIAMCDNKPVGMGIFYTTFSTFSGKTGIYIEDLFVTPDKRGLGIGKELITHIIGIADKRGCGKVSWSCLDWNTPAQNFYETIGAKAHGGTVYYDLFQQDFK